MAALYDLFRTPQPKGEEKVCYHARSVVKGKMTTRDFVHAIVGNVSVTFTFSDWMYF